MQQLNHVVLGLLIERPGYGYELKQRVDARFGFLSLSDGFVYGALDRLESIGYVEPAGPKGIGNTPRGAQRLVYRPTEHGLNAFARWMDAKPEGLPLSREDTHVKLLLASTSRELRSLLDHLHALERECVAALDDLRRSPSPSELIDSSMPWEQVAGYLVDDARAGRIRSVLDWLDGATEVVEKRLDSKEAGEGERVEQTRP